MVVVCIKDTVVAKFEARFVVFIYPHLCLNYAVLYIEFMRRFGHVRECRSFDCFLDCRTKSNVRSPIII